MTRRHTFTIVLCALFAACSAAPDNRTSDGDETPDAGEAVPDAGGNGVDAGNAAPDGGAGGADAGDNGPPNRKANGDWTITTANDLCGVDFRSGFTGRSLDNTTDTFQLVAKAKFMGTDMVFGCALVDDTTVFGCSLWQLGGVVAPNCFVQMELRDISGHIDGAHVDITATAQQSGGGTGCGFPTECGPGTISGTGTITR